MAFITHVPNQLSDLSFYGFFKLTRIFLALGINIVFLLIWWMYYYIALAPTICKTLKVNFVVEIIILTTMTTLTFVTWYLNAFALSLADNLISELGETVNKLLVDIQVELETPLKAVKQSVINCGPTTGLTGELNELERTRGELSVMWNESDIVKFQMWVPGIYTFIVITSFLILAYPYVKFMRYKLVTNIVAVMGCTFVLGAFIITGMPGSAMLDVLTEICEQNRDQKLNELVARFGTNCLDRNFRTICLYQQCPLRNNTNPFLGRRDALVASLPTPCPGVNLQQARYDLIDAYKWLDCSSIRPIYENARDKYMCQDLYDVSVYLAFVNGFTAIMFLALVFLADIQKILKTYSWSLW